MRRSRTATWVRRAVVALLLLWCLGPIVLGLLTSLSSQAEVQAGQWIPTTLNASGYRALLLPSGAQTAGGFVPSEVSAFSHAMVNSAIITIETTAVLIVLAVTAGYAFSRLTFPGRRFMLVSLVSTLIIPALAVIVPLWRIMALSVWGEFFIPLLFAPTATTKPVTVLITEFVGKYTTNQPLLAAAGIMTLLPPAVIAIVLSRHIRGLLSGWHG